MEGPQGWNQGEGRGPRDREPASGRGDHRQNNGGRGRGHNQRRRGGGRGGNWNQPQYNEGYDRGAYVEEPHNEDRFNPRPYRGRGNNRGYREQRRPRGGGFPNASSRSERHSVEFNRDNNNFAAEEPGNFRNPRAHPRRERSDNNWRQRNNTQQDAHNSSSLNPNAPVFQFRTEMEDERGDRGGGESELAQRDLTSSTSVVQREESKRRFKEKPRNQREVLIEQLSRGNHECMVCCEKVRVSQPIWSCKRCFNVFHLSCIRKWIDKSDDENGWRCPSCQSCHEASPEGYFCFCGKMKNPKTTKHDIPHTCGQICGKEKPGGINCTHTCISQCHPGPCPSCEVQRVQYCGCGRTQAQVLCGSKTVLACQSVCAKKLNCGTHNCPRTCHQNECEACGEVVKHACHCGREKKDVACTVESNRCKEYTCSKTCNKPLSCGKHKCEDNCHPGACGRCKTSPEVVISCPCGQTGISEACKVANMPERSKCTDPIPTCGKKCLRLLPCGDLENKHCCQQKCHFKPECAPCKLVSKRICRCGVKCIEIPCKELKCISEITCQKKCNKKRSCGKHKCNLNCCIDIDHICPIVCQRPLRCGLHKCSRLCHLNTCPPCDIASFDELTCECGASIIYPPVPCGTRRPPCLLPCSREHSCDHEVHHHCHSEPTCPPCIVLTEKWCHGKHELRKNVMCHITNVSCGLTCGKELTCKRHTCPKTCHAGQCLEENEVCKLPCTKQKVCGHACGAPCHSDECPESKCKVTTDVCCACGRRTDSMVCWKRENEYDRTVTWEFHKEVKKLEEEAKGKGEEATITEEMKKQIMDSLKDKIPRSHVLECDKECAKQERNRKLAEALQLEGGDVTTTSIGTPNYSEFLTKFAKKNPQFIESVHKQLTDLVIKAKQSTKKNVTYGFNSMNRDKRHVIHEYSDHFGILSESFDEEPNRNVICFASKEKSYLPSVTLIDAVFRPPAVRSERLKPHDDVTFRSEKRTQVVGPSNWNTKLKQTPSSQSGMVAFNIPGSSNGTADFPPL